MILQSCWHWKGRKDIWKTCVSLKVLLFIVFEVKCFVWKKRLTRK